MSRAYNARRKTKRQQARGVTAPAPSRHVLSPRRLGIILPVLLIAAVFAATAVLGSGADQGKSKEEVVQEVSALLAGVPQKGTTLGSPGAPITLLVFADLECPTVKRFVVRYLPSIINTWVRPGLVKLTYRPLRTDTYNERMFFRQEIAALAAGRQGKLWNFALTFVHEQGQRGTGYANDDFLADIAAQVPAMALGRWHDERDEPLLSKQVARSMHYANTQGMRDTPSFLLRVNKARADRAGVKNFASVRSDFIDSFKKDIDYLHEEAFGDVPKFKVFG